MKLLNSLNTNTKSKAMKIYYFIVTIFAIIGVTLLLGNYPILLGISCFGIGIGFKEYTQEEKEQVKKEEDIIDN